MDAACGWSSRNLTSRFKPKDTFVFVSRDKMPRQLVRASETSSEMESTYSGEWGDTGEQQMSDLHTMPEMRSVLDEMSRQHELHGRHEHPHHRYQQQQQQQQLSQRHGDDVKNTSSLTSLPADEYSTWFGWSSVDLSAHSDSSQHSSSKPFVPLLY